MNHHPDIKPAQRTWQPVNMEVSLSEDSLAQLERYAVRTGQACDAALDGLVTLALRSLDYEALYDDNGTLRCIHDEAKEVKVPLDAAARKAEAAPHSESAGQG